MTGMDLLMAMQKEHSDRFTLGTNSRGRAFVRVYLLLMYLDGSLGNHKCHLGEYSYSGALPPPNWNYAFSLAETPVRWDMEIGPRCLFTYSYEGDQQGLIQSTRADAHPDLGRPAGRVAWSGTAPG
jgi:hypothetical protein